MGYVLRTIVRFLSLLPKIEGQLMSCTTVFYQEVENYAGYSRTELGTSNYSRTRLLSEQMGGFCPRSPCVRASLVPFSAACHTDLITSPVGSSSRTVSFLPSICCTLHILLLRPNSNTQTLHLYSEQAFVTQIPFTRDLHERSSLMLPCCIYSKPAQIVCATPSSGAPQDGP